VDSYVHSQVDLTSREAVLDPHPRLEPVGY
jgi:hypothetical protein